MKNTKYCPKCERDRNVNCFGLSRSRKSGLDCYCLECERKRNSKYQSSAQGKATRQKWRKSEKGRVKRREYGRAYAATEAGKTYYAKKQRKYVKRHPEKIKAVAAVREAIRIGELTRPNYCEFCDDLAEHAHHWSYEEKHWLDVIWCCADHHRFIHLNLYN